MSVITLTTDWQSDPLYISSIKGVLLHHAPKSVIIDISHDIPLYNLTSAALILGNCYGYFPEGSIHIIGIRNDITEQAPALAALYKKHIFIAADNGIFGLLFNEAPERIIKIPQEWFATSATFPELIYAQMAAFLITGEISLESGEPVSTYKQSLFLKPSIEEAVIIGKVIYIDKFGNAITNISKVLFIDICKERKFTIYIKSNKNKISNINTFYNQSQPGDLLAVFNTMNLLEIAIRDARTDELLGLCVGDSVRINFG